jgi:MbtH protein
MRRPAAKRSMSRSLVPEVVSSNKPRIPDSQERRMAGDDEDVTVYNVVTNHEEQYSIWPSDREIPRGWSAVGISGNKVACLAHIKEVWVDMRPLSLRRQMDDAERPN